jgi:septin family protein
MEFFIDGKSPIELKAELAEERALRAQIEAERLKEHEERLKEREERLKERDRRMELERELELMKAQIAELKK